MGAAFGAVIARDHLHPLSDIKLLGVRHFRCLQRIHQQIVLFTVKAQHIEASLPDTPGITGSPELVNPLVRPVRNHVQIAAVSYRG